MMMNHGDQVDRSWSPVPASPASTLLRTSLDWDFSHSRQSTRAGLREGLAYDYVLTPQRKGLLSRDGFESFLAGGHRIPRVGDSRNLEGWSTTPNNEPFESLLVAGNLPRRCVQFCSSDAKSVVVFVCTSDGLCP